MKKTFLLVLSLMMAIIIKAGDVSPEQALQQAASFLKQRAASGNGHKKSPMQASELKMAGSVNGLYVFNIDESNGFVIVSNDDRTEPVLGYSDSGNLDPDNLPANMRAWLQGYADEIAWLNAHNAQPTVSHRAASDVKTPIEPLVMAQWDQGAPYNNQVANYHSSGDAATGCTATAMAQVMYYTAKQAGLTTTYPLADIPAYVSEKGNNIPGFSAGEAIHWDKMRDTYTQEDNDEGATAVATLMRCCGASLKTNYGYVSGAMASNIAPALITYFGYETTAKYKTRSFYSYANWIDMLYHELQQGRPILYDGYSTSSGHEFVCDGYQGEDYFHINWGWGGMSDGYFKLSVLDPEQQGIGGSSSTDGYYIGQGATVGIQLKGGTGTVLDNRNTVNLTLNSVSADKTLMTTGETALITFNITNNSTDDYDGEISYHTGYELVLGKMILIPAGETQDCVLEFSPEEAGKYKITAFIPTGNEMYNDIDEKKYVEITVAGGGDGPATDNVDLTLGVPTVENAEQIEGVKYNLYGNHLRATVRVTNSTEDNYLGRLYWKLLPASFKGEFYPDKINMAVPKGSYIDIPIEVDELDENVGSYKLYLSYCKDGQYASSQTYYYDMIPAITTYAADGTYTVTKSSGTSYAAPADALAVDLTGTTVTTVSGGAANCLFISDQTLTGAANILKKSGSTYTATDITLTDGNDFYSPVDFEASNIEFTYNNDRWADGSSGWNTIILPFDVTSVTANDTPIDWFHSATDNGKQFWLKKFKGDDTNAPKVYFDYATTMAANTPYIIALPGAHWGEAYDLSGKTIKFIGTNAEVKKSRQTVLSASNYRFIGDTRKVSTENIYCINAAGNTFELKATGGSAAFRPFFKADIFDRYVTSLGIVNGGGTTGIGAMLNDKGEMTNDSWYTLDGRKLSPVPSHQSSLKKGLYIVNGKKVVIK